MAKASRGGRRVPAADGLARLAGRVEGVEYLVHVVAAALLRALEAVRVGPVLDGPAIGFGSFLEALGDGLAPFRAEIPGGSSVTRPRPPGVRPGVCGFCGCTEARPCPGGCGWANAERTLCTRCDAELATLPRTLTSAAGVLVVKLDAAPHKAPGGRQKGAAGRATSRPAAAAIAPGRPAKPARPGASRPAPATPSPRRSRAGA
jgi:hypothetical protein